MLTEQSSCSWPSVSSAYSEFAPLKGPSLETPSGCGEMEHWFTFLRTHVQFPEPTWLLTAVRNSCCRGSDTCMHASIWELDSTENWGLFQKLSAVSLECWNFLVTCNPIVTTRKNRHKVYTGEIVVFNVLLLKELNVKNQWREWALRYTAKEFILILKY